MTDTQVSPISQLLHTLGITREDLNKRSDQMRQFLTADTSVAPRANDREREHRSRSGSDLRSSSRSVASSASVARSSSRASSSSLRDGTPPATPVKPEPHDAEIPHRRMDSMEMVLERQRRQRKSRKGRERDSSRNVVPPPSPSPSNASKSAQNLNTSRYSRDTSRSSESGNAESAQSAPAEINDPPPVTPQKSKYYRDHTNLSTDSVSRKDSTCKTETPTPTRLVAQQPSQSLPLPQYYAYPAYMGYPHFVPMTYRPQASSSSSIPITPQPQRTQLSFSKSTSSPLPPSSPPASSPMSSPVRGVNLVSSPGPMGPAPEENEYDNLPYKLPPGPYSPTKPDLSYAALVGRAILSSPEHRLTLQEIYDWITIVYPHYKRGETTWMNSIRHVLSTTVCFRKVPRDRAVGRTLWAIYDEDLECFKDGGFKKQLCKDYINGNDGKEKAVGSAKGKGKTRKRGADDEELVEGRKVKKARKEAVFGGAPSSDASGLQASFLGPPPMSSHPLFPPTRPTTHHQPYYQSCVQQPQTFPTEVIFPPLPPTAAFNRVVNNHVTSSVSSSSATATDPSVSDNTGPSSPSSHVSPISSLPSMSSSISSVPELTPNRNSSSPPSSMPATSEADIDMNNSRPSSAASILSSSNAAVVIADLGSNGASIDSCSTSNDGDDDSIFNTSLLGPVRFWGESPKDSVLQPGIELLNFDYDSDDDGASQDRKGKKKQTSRKNSMFPPVPASLTLHVKQSFMKTEAIGRPSTPVSLLDPPSTPPRSTHQISSIRTPISHKGLHMSPSASLAHYKSNLDPPPAYGGGGVPPLDLAMEQDDDDPMRTPRKRLLNPAGGNVFFGQPVTPRKLTFPGTGDSPFRTPMAGSPFRTPSSRSSILDPHDPRALLHEELNNRAYDDSPGGIFGKGRGSLLYDSPGYDTPAKWW